MRTANALTGMCGCAGSSEHLLVAYVLSDRIQFEINPFSFLYLNPNVPRTLLLKKLLLLLSSGARGNNFATPIQKVSSEGF